MSVSQGSQREREMAHRAPTPLQRISTGGRLFVLERIKKEKKMNIFERNTVMTEA